MTWDIFNTKKVKSLETRVFALEQLNLVMNQLHSQPETIKPVKPKPKQSKKFAQLKFPKLSTYKPEQPISNILPAKPQIRKSPLIMSILKTQATGELFNAYTLAVDIGQSYPHLEPLMLKKRIRNLLYRYEQQKKIKSIIIPGESRKYKWIQ